MPRQPIQLELSDASRRLLSELARFRSRQVVLGAMVKFFDRQGALMAGRISRQVLKKHRRTGQLARSIVGRGELLGGAPAVRVGIFKGPALRYAGVQEFGTKGKAEDSPYPTIVPKRAKALAVPVGRSSDPTGSLTPAGVARTTSPRQDPRDLTFVPIDGKRLIGGLFETASLKREQERARRAGRPVSLRKARMAYMLLKAADIEPKRFLRGGFPDEVPKLLRELNVFLRRMLTARTDGELRRLLGLGA